MVKICTVFKDTDQEFTGNLREISQHFNIDYPSFLNRIQRGYSVEEAINWEDSRGKKCTVFKGTDKEFTGNYTEIAKHFNINYNVLKGRLNKGYSLEEAIDWNGGKVAKKYTVFEDTDREFTGNIVEIAKYFSMSRELLRDRVKLGYSLEEAIDWNGGKNNVGLSYTVFEGTDREFTGNKKEIAEHFNVIYTSFINRVRLYGLSLEEAIDIPLRQVKVNNLLYKNFKGSLKEICKHFNKNYIEVYNKLRYNHTLEWSIESTTEPYIEE